MNNDNHGSSKILSVNLMSGVGDCLNLFFYCCDGDQKRLQRKEMIWLAYCMSQQGTEGKQDRNLDRFHGS